ncbi:trypsin-like peptidase domain-containing protein [Streptomyces sp. NPDC050617]|uniref:S1C family serine protease n=1 Tax=Streptomyces sp. NPDC050617 TaxID=3154628 RepID=UPI00343A8025
MTESHRPSGSQDPYQQQPSGYPDPPAHAPEQPEQPPHHGQTPPPYGASPQYGQHGQPITTATGVTVWPGGSGGSGEGGGHGDSGGAAFHGDGSPAAGAVPAPVRHGARKKTVGLLAAVALAAAVIGGGTAALVAGAANGSSSSSVSAPVSNAATKSSGVAAVAKAVSPSIVEVQATTASGQSTGSGVVVTKSGEIVTNNHVVSGADTVKVKTSDGSTRTADVVGTDPDKDLALIKVRDAKDLKPAALGDSSKVQVGDDVVAIGSPEGLTGTVTSGIVSALNRDVTVAKEPGKGQEQEQQGPGGRGSERPWPFEFGGEQYNGDTGSSKTTYKAIQTDASLNPGNSGGALINMNGQVIGINSAMYPTGSSGSESGSAGLGFSIPINTVKADLAKLRSGGSS